MKSEKEIEKFKKIINRQRTNPRIWDYTYLMLRSNLITFKKFRDLLINENKTKILDVGCGFKPWLAFFDRNNVEYTGIDFEKETSSADFIGSSENLPFSENTFDALIYSEVFEHIKNLNPALKELRRVSKNNSLIFISSPFIFPEHGIPNDFQRLTQYFYEEVFKKDEIIEIKPSNSSFSTPLLVLNLLIQTSPLKKIYGVKNLIFIINNLSGIIIDRIIEFVSSKLFKTHKKSFYSMPLGYSLIVRIKK